MKKVASFCIILFWSVNFVWAQLSFKPSISLEENFNPGPMVSGDFDGNSFPDLALLDQNNKRVLLYYNPGQVSDPQLQIFQVQSAGKGSVMSLVAADFNKDGKADLALIDYANNQQYLVLLTSTGSSFSQQSSIPSLQFNFFDYALKALDYDQDGNADLIVSNAISFHFYKGDGTGGFSVSTLSNLPKIYNSNYFRYEVVDMNADGANDFVFTAADTIFVSLQNSNHSFTTTKYLMPSSDHIALSLGTGDLTGDGLREILITYQINNTSSTPNFIDEYVNDGSGSFSSAPVTIFSGALWTPPLVVQDFDGDGRNDVLTGWLSYGNEFALLKNAGNNQFTAISTSSNYSVEDVTCLFVDLNNDGTQEIVTLSYFKFINIFSRSGGTFQYDHRLVFGAPAFRGQTVDVNNDGLLDIVSCSQLSGSVAMYLNQGDGGFAPAVYFTEDSGLEAVQVADFNGDGVPDIAYSSVYGTTNAFIKVILSDANGKLTVKKTVINSGAVVLAAADFNKDGFMDLAADNAIYFNDGSGNFSSSYFSTGVNPFGAAAIDVNNDTWPDLIYNDASVTYIGINDGSGHFPTFSTLTSSGYVYGLDVVDMNNDNLPDILSIHTGTNGTDGFSLFINQGDGSFQQIIVPGPPGENVFWNAVGGDLNNDGRKDVAIVSGSNAPDGVGGFSIYLQQTDGTFVYYSSVPIVGNQGWSIVDYLRIADMNNDGKKDIVSYATNGDAIQVTFNDLITTPTLAAQIELTRLYDTQATFSLSGGNGNGKLAVIRKSGTSPGKPVNNIFYSSNAQYGIGAQIGSNNYVVLLKDTTAFTVTGLTRTTSYTLDVYSYNVNSTNTLTNILISQPDSIAFTTKDAQTITVSSVPDQPFGARPVVLSASVSTGRPVTYSSTSGGVTIKGDTVSLDSPGPVKIIATVAGDTTLMPVVAEIDFCIDPPVPAIAQNKTGTLISLTSSSASNNIWLFNDAPIDSAKNATLPVVNNGIYKVQVNIGGCKSTSLPTGFLIDGIIDKKDNYNSYPNPFNEVLYVPLSGQATQLELFDATGRKVMEKSVLGQTEEWLNTGYLVPGLYVLYLRTDQGILPQKVMKIGN